MNVNGDWLSVVRQKRPLIHCITNPISISFMADALSAIGARPLMAAYPPEVAEIGSDAAALLINLGNITAERMQAMERANEAARVVKRPVILDMNGMAASSIRRRFGEQLVSTGGVSCIKGNYSEIMAFANNCHYGGGVDSIHRSESKNEIKMAILTLARRFDIVVFASGETDFITDGKKIVALENGSSDLGAVVGTGCVLGALITAFSAVTNIFEAAYIAGVLWGICGEQTSMHSGPRQYATDIVTALYRATPEIYNQAKIEQILLMG